MSNQIFEEAQSLYAVGRFQEALGKFITCAQNLEGLTDAELCKFYHLLGNCYIKCSRPSAASAAYSMALENAPSSKKPALYVNLGTSLLASEKNTEALVAFNNALQFEDYASRYKAFSGIGAAQLQLGNTVEAGAAYREAAIDRANPTPAKALVNLGVCFMEMGRTEDAIVSYETALDLGLEGNIRNKANANLGQAYMAQGRFFDALDAFELASDDGKYKLNELAAHDYAIAKSLDLRYGDDLDALYVAKSNELFSEDGNLKKPYQTGEIDVEDSAIEDNLALEENQIDPSAQTTMSFAPAAIPAVAADNNIADMHKDEDLDSQPDEAGMRPDLLETSSFFNVGPEDEDEENPDMFEPAQNHYANASDDAFMHQPYSFEMLEQDDTIRKRKQKKRRRKIITTILVALIICIVLALGAATAAYFMGYGYPLQEDVVTDHFEAVRDKGDTQKAWSDDVDENVVSKKNAMISNVDNQEISAMERSSTESEAYVKGHLKEGGTLYFKVSLVRDKISWSIKDIDYYWPNQ